MGSLIKDIHYGLRNLARRPSYTAIALITLALGEMTLPQFERNE